jgi:diguanylate cyclase (GGDEF)-like protein/PAS domain S-box-containing protein
MSLRPEADLFVRTERGPAAPPAFRASALIEPILRTAASLLNVPAVVADFVDARLRWARAYCGPAPNWGEREFAISHHLFASSELLVLEDLGADSRLAERPLKIGGVQIRSCASAPIRRPSGELLGALCAFDHRPEPWRPARVTALGELADLTGLILSWFLDELTHPAQDWLASEPRLLTLFEHTTDLVYIHNLRGEITAVNRTAERLLGFPREELLGRNIDTLVAPQHQETVRQMILNQFGGGVAQTCNLEFRAKDGRLLPLEVDTHLLFERGQPVGLMAFGRSAPAQPGLSETQRRLHARLEEVTADLSRTTRGLKALRRLSRTDFPTPASRFAGYLKTGCRLFDLPIGMLVEIQGSEAVILAASGDAALGAQQRVPLASTSLRHAVARGKTCQHVCASPRLNQPVYADQAAALLVATPIPAGAGARWVLAFASRQKRPRLNAHSRTALELLAEALGRALQETETQVQAASEAAALFDSSAGFLPATQAVQRLAERIERARASGEGLALALLDLDRFKQFNNALGHTVGDRLLHRIAERLRRAAGADELVARLDSDSFLFVFPCHGPAEASLRISQLLETLRRPFPFNDLELFVTASAGISLFPVDGQDLGSLLWCADAALGEAKRTGRNHVKLYTPEDQTSVLWLLELESALRKALENKQLEIRFQPVLTRDGTVHGLEALLAWRHPARGLVPAEEFIRIAEDTGIIVPVGAWVLEEACRLAASWQQGARRPVRLAVNVSALQFARDGFVELVAAALRKSGLPPELLELEITESAVMRDLPPSAQAMNRLRALGVHIAIDDFGTGYSSLSYLQHLPVDAVKIDRSFLHPAGAPRSSRPLFAAIVALARSLGLATVAEGVESPEQLELARQAGCDRVQGFLFGQPMPAAAVRRFLRRRRQA